MEDHKEQNPLGYEPVGKLLRGFAIPSIIAMVVSSLYNVVDQIFIGQGVGYLGNAATNVAFPLTTICMAITLTISIGSAAQFSLFLGRKEEEEAAKTVGNGVCMMITFGVLYAILVELLVPVCLPLFGATTEVYPLAMVYTRITAIGMPFLVTNNGMSNLARADGKPMYSMMCMVLGAIINTILDPIFIFGFHWGVAGAAWATIIGQIISCIVALCYLGRFERVTLRKEYFRLSLHRMGRTAVMGMSNGLTQLAITLVQIVMNRSLVNYGALSIYGAEIPLAASGIVMKVNGILLSVLIGINQGIQPIIGFNYGAKKYDRVRATYFLALKWDLAIGMVGLILFECFPETVLSIFGSEDALYMEFSVLFMRIFLMLVPLNGVQMLSSNFFAVIGKPLKGAMLSLTRQVFFLIPLVLILPLFWGINGCMIAAPIADLLAFLVVLYFIRKELHSMLLLSKAQAV